MKNEIIKKENRNKKLSKRTIKYIKILLYIIILTLIYVLSPLFEKLLKIGLKLIINIPSENITRIISIILALEFSRMIVKNNKKENK